MTTEMLLEKVYAGFLGMNIGIRLGAPVEPTVWTADRIRRFYGDITDYVKEYKNFAADDDVNGPVFFLRALYDKKGKTLTAQDVADAWLNYCREGVGMFWWGGYGISTEHTAYLNLKHGIPAPQSGSTSCNGLIMSEQIGGQIFVDTWGFVCPGEPQKAAHFAALAASVSHDGNGIYGGMFIAACIAQAFVTQDIDAIIDAGLAQIPMDCTYARIVSAVRVFHNEHPLNFMDALHYLQENWGYDRYKGVCHIIPNAGVCVLAMLYGQTFARAVEITTMCGWDTDCNAGNVGSIMGTAQGLSALPEHYRKPINDGIILSGISGYLNILDVPTYVKELVILGLNLANKDVPAELASSVVAGEINFDFEMSGSTHNFRLSDPSLCSLRHCSSSAHTGNGLLEVLFDRMVRGQQCRLYYKPFYRRADFDDERYMPVFSPTVYPGQQVSAWLRTEHFSGTEIAVTPYVQNSSTGEFVLLDGRLLSSSDWQHFTFEVPDISGAMISEVGFLLEACGKAKGKDFGCLYLDDFSITGKASYTIEISQQSKEFASITPFSHNHGAWELRDGYMEAMCLDHAEAMTGSYYMRNVRVCGSVTPHTGDSHLVSVRVQGALRGYYGGLSKDGAAIYSNNGKLCLLASVSFSWVAEKKYQVMLTAQNNLISLSIDGQPVLEVADASYEYGMAGYAMYGQGRCGFGDISIEELE